MFKSTFKTIRGEKRDETGPKVYGINWFKVVGLWRAKLLSIRKKTGESCNSFPKPVASIMPKL